MGFEGQNPLEARKHLADVLRGLVGNSCRSYLYKYYDNP